MQYVLEYLVGDENEYVILIVAYEDFKYKTFCLNIGIKAFFDASERILSTKKAKRWVKHPPYF